MSTAMRRSSLEDDHSLHTREASCSWQYEQMPSFSSFGSGGGLSRSGHDGIKRPDHVSRTSGLYGTCKRAKIGEKNRNVIALCP